MQTMVILILLKLEQIEEVMRAWHHAGAGGITIIESSGAGQYLAESGLRDDLPLFPGLRTLLSTQEVHHRTLFTVLPERVDVDEFFTATETVVGDLDVPNSGFMFAIPVIKVAGENRKKYED
jgi:hypothetical protein